MYFIYYLNTTWKLFSSLVKILPFVYRKFILSRQLYWASIWYRDKNFFLLLVQFFIFLLFYYFIILSFYRLIILLFYDFIILLFYDFMILWFYDFMILSFYYFVILLFCYFVILLFSCLKRSDTDIDQIIKHLFYTLSRCRFMGVKILQ